MSRPPFVVAAILSTFPLTPGAFSGPGWLPFPVSWIEWRVKAVSGKALFEGRIGGPLPPYAINAGSRLSPDGRRLLLDDGSGVRAWRVETGKAPAPRFGHGGRVADAVFSPDGSRVLTWGSNTVQIEDADTAATVALPLQHKAAVLQAAFSPGGRLVATACGDGSAFVHDIATGKQLFRVSEGDPDVAHLSFSPDGRSLLTVQAKLDRATAQLRDVVSGAIYWEIQRAAALLPGLSRGWMPRGEFSPDGRVILLHDCDGLTRLIDPGSGAALPCPPGRNPDRGEADRSAGSGVFALPWPSPRSYRFSPDGRSVLAIDQDKTQKGGEVWLWDIVPRQPRPILLEKPLVPIEGKPDRTLAVSPGRATWFAGRSSRL